MDFFKGKTVVVTGAASGIGRALAECSAPDPASLEAIETLDHETRLRVGLWIEKV